MARTLYPLCLLALVCPIAAKIPIRDNGPARDGAQVSGQFSKIASTTKRDEAPPPNTTTRRIYSSGVPAPPAASPASPQKNDDDVEEILNAPKSHAPAISVGVGAGAGGSLSLIQKLLSSSAEPILRSISFGAQLVIGCYLAKASWNVMKEVWDEVNEEFTAARRGRGGLGDVREEQDMPYADEDALMDRDESDGEDTDEGNSRQPQRRQPWQSQNDGTSTAQTTATRELAARLRSAGIPYASEVLGDNGKSCTVEGIVRSLTRAEGNVLTQTLLTPLDGGLLDGAGDTGSPAAAAAAWNAIGGLENAKESLLDLAFPLLPSHSDSEKNDYYGGLLANPPGVLLYGPPGCGKTMLVRALAATIGARFLVVSPSCLLRKYVGETNLNVRALFSVANKISPCVIFVDELDGLFRERGGEDHDVGRDLKTEFLQLWDGVRNNGQNDGRGASSSVLVIGATNRPFEVDPAFLRRMPRRVFVGLPDHDSRQSVLQNMLRQVPLDPNFDLDIVASKTGGYSPSDLREVLQTAALYPLREARAEAMMSSAQNGRGEQSDAGAPFRMQMPPLRKLRTDDIMRALEVSKPTHFSRKYQRDLMNYVHSSGGSSQIDPISPSVTERDTDDGYFSADANTFGGHGEDESDTYSYDDDSSDEYDDL